VCWSLDRSVALKFPFLNRYEVPDAVLVTATVKKSSVLAFLLSREEEEIVTFKAIRTSVESIIESCSA
jgi:hypothetical protein